MCVVLCCVVLHRCVACLYIRREYDYDYDYDYEYVSKYSNIAMDNTNDNADADVIGVL